MEWKEVTKDEFYNEMVPLDDVDPYLDSTVTYPYNLWFKTRKGEIKGRLVRHIPGDEAFPEVRYYLPKEDNTCCG